MINEKLYQEYLKNKDLVTLKKTSDPNLFVLKYKKKVFFGDCWNDFLRECRGLIVDNDWNIVSLPFTKIHNYGIEKDAPEFEDNEQVFYSRKVNGFMIACTWYNDDLLWSTTGSIDSEFVGYAKEIFGKFSQEEQSFFREKIESSPNVTFMFECVHPSDPHIVYEQPGLYFLGARMKLFSEKTWLYVSETESHHWQHTGVKIVESEYARFSELRKMASEASHEGYVFESMDGTRVSKIKSPHYLTKKFMMRSSREKILGSQRDLPEEFIELVSWVREVERDAFFELDEIARREYIEKWFTKKLT